MLQKKLQNVFMINVFVFVGILLMVSIGLAQSGIWTPKANIPTKRCFAASCEVDGKIYVIGGSQTTTSRLNVMEVYDPVTDTWDTSKKNMPTARVELCAAAVNGKIYAIGGATSHVGSPLGMVEEYDPLTDTWDTNKQPMPTARMGAAWGVINNKVYIAGGSATGSPNWTISNKLEIYDPATDTWTSGANMLTDRYYPRGVVLKDTLYVIGGLKGSPWTGQNAVQQYDPISDNWYWGTNLNTGRVGHSADAFNGKIYVIGGDKQPPMQQNVEEYDPLTKTWTEFGTTSGPITLHASSVYDNMLYVFSGSTQGIGQLSPTASVYAYDVISSIELLKNQRPVVFTLHQNFPNPFNPSTTIRYQIPKASQVDLSIYNLLGQKVTTLVSVKQSAGNYKVQWEAIGFASGVYFYRLQTNKGFSQTRKLILMR